MSNRNATSRKVNIIGSCLVILGLVVKVINYYYGPVEITIWRTLIYYVLLGLWGASIYWRIINPIVRNALMTIAGLSAFWMTAKYLRWTVLSGTPAARICWYLFYLPMIFIPTFSFLMALGLGKNKKYTSPKFAYIALTISTILFAVVMTNNYHSLVFDIPDGPLGDKVGNYSYGPMYVVVYIWVALLVIAAAGILLSKCRNPDSKRFYWVPVVPIALLFLYGVAYILALPIVKTPYLNDITAVFTVLMIIVFEAFIQSGIVASNSNYIDLIKASTIPALIMSSGKKVVVSSAGADSINLKEAIEMEAGSRILEDKVRLSKVPIRDAYVVWTEDVSAVRQLELELSDAHEQLEGNAETLQKKLETDKRRYQLSEQNRLYNMMVANTQFHVERLSSLVDQLEKETDPEKEVLLLKEISVIATYIKRRNNMIFLAENNENISIMELVYCLKEIVNHLNSFGTKGTVAAEIEGMIPVGLMTDYFDRYIRLIDAALPTLSFIFVTVMQQEENIILSIRMSCREGLRGLSDNMMSIHQEDENDWLVTIKNRRNV